MALTEDRQTPYQDAEILSVPVAASTKIFAGALVAANATGYAQGGAAATTLTYLGRAEEQVDNSAGVDGDLNIKVRRGKAFKFKNSGTDAVTQAELGKSCYIEDDETVAKTDGTGTLSACGKVVGIEGNFVWVE
ncbi:hypothetical protein BOW53_03000 [Solemya pervernicosa gill symbiont]|uniref:Uncharacterized protein n=1 Tax=Solemya pervernicosa gill symbiont TaxID=642797 RepID=A0A1T2L9F3_9GAMM|nr:hypothetical protein [Solemya pervernicosa gill symbiont]OOZ41662.1 hypothetical protein BOW53_03000 [Solemya pervernicosa gill symbiont]